MRKLFVVCTILAVCGTASLAEARSVYLNGVDISSIRNKKFLKAEVTIDSDGNVRIHAPQYDVRVVDDSAKTERRTPNDRGGPNAKLTKRYYLVTQPSAGGMAQYDFSITVNGEEKKVIRAGASQVIVEMSKWLQRGENEIVVRAIKNTAGGRKSSQASVKSKLLIGIGHEENKIVKIDYIKARVEADASQTRNITKHFVLTAE